MKNVTKENKPILIATIGVAFFLLVMLFLPPVFLHQETVMNHVSGEPGERYTYIGVWSDRAFKKESFPSCVTESVKRESNTPGFAVSYPSCDRRNVTIYDAMLTASTDESKTHRLSYPKPNERENWSFLLTTTDSTATGYGGQLYQRISSIHGLYFWVSTLMWPF